MANQRTRRKSCSKIGTNAIPPLSHCRFMLSKPQLVYRIKSHNHLINESKASYEFMHWKLQCWACSGKLLSDLIYFVQVPLFTLWKFRSVSKETVKCADHFLLRWFAETATSRLQSMRYVFYWKGIVWTFSMPNCIVFGFLAGCVSRYCCSPRSMRQGRRVECGDSRPLLHIETTIENLEKVQCRGRTPSERIEPTEGRLPSSKRRN